MHVWSSPLGLHWVSIEIVPRTIRRPALTHWIGDDLPLINHDEAGRRAEAIAEGLNPHQVAGVGFLIGRCRSILADDMGLGKTHQSIIALTTVAPVAGCLPGVGQA